MTPLPMGNVIRVPADGAQLVSITAVGDEIDDEKGKIARLRSGESTVTVRVSVANAAALEVGAEAEVTATADSALQAGATVTAVSEFMDSTTDVSQLPGYDVTVTLPEDQPFDAGQGVTVTPSEEPPVTAGLAVPIVALREDSVGTYVLLVAAVSESAGADVSSSRVDVSVEAMADGYAVVTGEGIAEGAEVLLTGTS
jgi:hypothetical protein